VGGKERIRKRRLLALTSYHTVLPETSPNTAKQQPHTFS
jgi:hypothetical protein